jgi:hypothetical protein
MRTVKNDSTELDGFGRDLTLSGERYGRENRASHAEVALGSGATRAGRKQAPGCRVSPLTAASGHSGVWEVLIGFFTETRSR